MRSMQLKVEVVREVRLVGWMRDRFGVRFGSWSVGDERAVRAMIAQSGGIR